MSRIRIELELEIEFDYDYRPGKPPIMPSFRDEVGDPGYGEEIEFTKLRSFAILEPRRDPTPEGGWTKTKWVPNNILDHILKWMPEDKLCDLLLSNDYLREMAEDEVRRNEEP